MGRVLPPARLQMGGRILKARDLRLLGRQIIDGVIDQEHERECAIHPRRCHIPDCNIHGGTGFFPSKFRNHGFGKFNPR